MEEKQHLCPNRIVQFFDKKTILITGASGFLGQVLVEKLLRSCSSLNKIYVIIRGKRGKNAGDRLQEILNGPLFDRVRTEQGPTIVEKVQAVSGDANELDLGLCLEDRRKLNEETEIIYHCAATTRFDLPLKDTILLNVRGTKLMLELARGCRKLMAFCYTSTAYCHEDEEVLAEEFYPCAFDPHHIIQLCEWLNTEVLDRIDQDLRCSHVNNYSFSKALAEALVEEQKDNLPVVIQRPSLVFNIYREPLPGWASNMYGPTGLLIAAGKGVVRTMYGRDDICIDAVAADLVINAMIVSTYDFCTNKSRRVYNITASEDTDKMGLTIKKIIDVGRTIVTQKMAFSQVLWYPNGSVTQSKITHLSRFLFFQLLPAFFLDGIFFVVGVKPFMFRVQKKIWKAYQVLEYYVCRKWIFLNENLQILRRMLNSEEAEMFKIDAEGLDLYDYLTNCMVAARRYLLKEPDSDVDAALRRIKILGYVDSLCKTIFVVGILYYCFMRFVYS